MAKILKNNLSDAQLSQVFKDFRNSIKFKLWLSSDEIKYFFVINLLKLLSWGTAKKLTITTQEICELYTIYQPNFKIFRVFKTKLVKPYKQKTQKQNETTEQ